MQATVAYPQQQQSGTTCHFFKFLIRLHMSTFDFTHLVTRLHSHIRLHLSGDSSTFVYIRLDLSSVSPVFLEQILKNREFQEKTNKFCKAKKQKRKLTYIFKFSKILGEELPTFSCNSVYNEFQQSYNNTGIRILIHSI